jgi:isopentenyl phosphate kinase
MNLVKLGGSVITDKSKLRTFRRAACDRLARELRAADDGLGIVHGAGSFGHIEAKRHSLHEGFREDKQLKYVARVQRDVRELNVKVLESLIDNGIRAVSVPPAAAGVFWDGQIHSFDREPFESVLKLGLTPVSFGDVVPDESMGFSICSGDLIMQALAKEFKPATVIFCADVDGVFEADPKRVRRARLIAKLDPETLRSINRTQSKNVDVTGSIYAKLERMLAISRDCEKCMIVNGNVPGRLARALRGEEIVSTVVVPG